MNDSEKCPCGNVYEGQALPYADCCEPFIENVRKPEHCEQLMRSRYTAYSMAKVDYLIATWHPSKQPGLIRQDLLQSAESTTWLRLQVMRSSQQGTVGTVEFNAWYSDNEADEGSEKNEVNCLHEISRFEKVGDQWFYVDGVVDSGSQSKIGRNDPCPCGSGKKFKKCCG